MTVVKNGLVKPLVHLINSLVVSGVAPDTTKMRFVDYASYGM